MGEARLNQRLAELCAQQTPGPDLVKILNEEFGLGWTFQAFFQLVQRRGLRWTPRARAGRQRPSTECLAEEQRRACYEDPAYEARNGIVDRVICRECFAILRDGAMQSHGKHGHSGHVRAIDKMSLKQYRLRNPGARTFTFERIAQQLGRGVRELMAKEVEKFATPDERAAAAADPEYEDHKDIKGYVICRVERCGFKSRRLNNHIYAHGMKVIEYRREYRWPPVMAREVRDEAAERARQNKLAKAQAEQMPSTHLPDDWKTKPLWWLTLGTFFLANRGATNTEGTAYLDKVGAKRERCRKGETWLEAIKRPSVMNDFSRVRRWVGVPGMIASKKGCQST